MGNATLESTALFVSKGGGPFGQCVKNSLGKASYRSLDDGKDNRLQKDEE